MIICIAYNLAIHIHGSLIFILVIKKNSKFKLLEKKSFLSFSDFFVYKP